MLKQNTSTTKFRSVAAVLTLSTMLALLPIENIATPAVAAPDGEFVIRVMTITTGDETQEVIEEHLDENDFINNFRLGALDKFPEQQSMLNTESHDTIEDAIEDEVDVDYIAYDNERSNGDLSTPSEELEDPAESTNEAIDMIHDGGYSSAMAPTRSLLMEEYQDVDFEKVDFLNMQLQKVVGESEFEDIASKVSEEARSEHSDIIITAQVNPSFNSIEEIVDQAEEVQDHVDGISIIWNMDDSEAEVLDELLTELGR
jgi:hypothetical protein